MKLVEHSGDQFVFEFQHREYQVFQAVLEMYPVLNPDYHQITREPTDDQRLAESQELLREAMAAQREENRKRVAAFLGENNWEQHGARMRVKMTGDEIEWILQVLNDIRVGSWVILGKPDHEKGEMPEVTLDKMPYAGALEVCGYFQMAFLQTKGI